MELTASRLVAIIALFALVPAVLYLLGRADPIVLLSLVSVLILAATFYRLFGGGEEEEEAGGAASR